MKLINGLIERLALASALIVAALIALISPTFVVKQGKELYGNALNAESHPPAPPSKGEHPSRLSSDSPQGESENGQKLKPETD